MQQQETTPLSLIEPRRPRTSSTATLQPSGSLSSMHPATDPVPHLELEQNGYFGIGIRKENPVDATGPGDTHDIECGIRIRSGSDPLDPASPANKPRFGVVKGPDEDGPTTLPPSEDHPSTTRSPSISARRSVAQRCYCSLAEPVARRSATHPGDCPREE